MHEREILLVSRWKELERELVENYESDIDIQNYLLRTTYPDLPITGDFVYFDFLDIWDEIRVCCNSSRAKNVATAFFVEWEPFDEKIQEWRRRKHELPLHKVLEVNRPGGIWALVTCALNPESVVEIAKVTETFDLDSYMVHFHKASPISYLQDKQAFKSYSQAWLDLFTLAASKGTGVVFVRR